MSNPEKNSDYADLISRYLSGEASEAEVQQLEDWVLENEEHQATFIAARKTWILAGMGKAEDSIEVQEAWDKMRTEIRPQGQVVPMRSSGRFWLGIAAGVAVVILVGLGILWNGRQSVWTEVVAEGRVMLVELPDGTRVNLNRGSLLRYPTQLSKGERKVVLIGGGFFEVEKDENRPFIVDAKPVQVEVLGTSFYVDARPSEPAVQVIVESGEVRVSAAGKQEELGAREKAVFTKNTETLSPVANADENYRSLLTDALVFENSPIEEVVFALKRHFGVEMSIDIPDTSNCGVTATYENQSLDALLLILETTLGIAVTREDGQILLSATACR